MPTRALSFQIKGIVLFHIITKMVYFELISYIDDFDLQYNNFAIQHRILKTTIPMNQLN